MTNLRFKHLRKERKGKMIKETSNTYTSLMVKDRHVRKGKGKVLAGRWLGRCGCLMRRDRG
jgi:hypothetical protein